LFNNPLGFTGRLDLLLKLNSDLVALVDIKTPVTESPLWKVQLSAYRYLLQEAGIKVDTAIALQPRRNGTQAKAYRWDEWQDHFAVFLSALNAHRNLV
jgi:predicted RecB family nuclease